MPSRISDLQRARESYLPKLPPVFREGGANVTVSPGNSIQPADAARIEALFPETFGTQSVEFGPARVVGDNPELRVGVILSGGQAPGGHNVIAGLFDGLKSLNPSNRLFGFLGGPGGLLDNKYVEITAALLQPYRNTGGFDIIQSGRTKLETEEQFDTTLANCRALGITGLVVIGGDDSNTNAAMLAEYARHVGADLAVIGAPKTIDGDLKNEAIETSFGFDTACKVYSELIGNIERDAMSARKYWHFIRVMGRSASHIALECALQTHANVTIISEEVAAKALTLNQIAESIVDVVAARAAKGWNFGTVIIPEGLIEFVPEMKILIGELNDQLAHGKTPDVYIAATGAAELAALGLSAGSAAAYLSLPAGIRQQLVLDRDPHGNVQVAKIETERLFMAMVEERLNARKAAGAYKGKFSSQNHYLGYEGRCAPPTNFDADYCYSLGYTASALIGAGFTGYIAAVRHLSRGADHWRAGGVPLTSMMNMERRHGKDKPVIRKALVELDGRPFKIFADHREEWATENDYVYPGPIQYFGPSTVCDQATLTLALEQS